MQAAHPFCEANTSFLELQSHFGDIPLKFQAVCPQNGTAVLKGLLSLLGLEEGKLKTKGDDHSRDHGETPLCGVQSRLEDKTTQF